MGPASTFQPSTLLFPLTLDSTSDLIKVVGKMALGTALSNLLGLKYLDQQIVGDTKILMASIKMKKSQFTRFLGAEDGSSEELLHQQLNLWLSSTISYPVINKIQELSLIDILSTMINEATKLKSTLCQFFLYKRQYFQPRNPY